MRLFTSANASLLTEPSGPAMPALRFWVARRLVSRSTSASVQSAATLSRATGSRRRSLGQAAPEPHEVADRTGLALRDRAADRHTLVHQRGHRDAPAVAGVADAVAVGDAHVGHVDLVELRLAGDLHERPDLDPGRVHVEGEVREALVLRDVRVRARDEHPAVGHVRERVPDLLAVDDPLVAVAHRPGRERREVGAGAGLAEELAPDLFAGEERAEQAGPGLRLRVLARSSAPRGRGRSRSSRSRGTRSARSRRRLSTMRWSAGSAPSPP